MFITLSARGITHVHYYETPTARCEQLLRWVRKMRTDERECLARALLTRREDYKTKYWLELRLRVQRLHGLKGEALVRPLLAAVEVFFADQGPDAAEDFVLRVLIYADIGAREAFAKEPT